MKKNLTLTLIVLVLVSILAYLKYNKSKTNFEEVCFNIEHIEEMNSIDIEDKYGNNTSLRKKEGKWIVNDSFYAEKDKMTLLLNTLNKLQVEMPIGDSMRKMAIQDLRTLGKKIVLKNVDGEEIKTIFVGSQMGNGNIMILSTNGIISADPYIVKIPGIKSVDLKHRFPAEPEVWQSTEVFSTSLDKIKSISVRFHEYPEFSFNLEKDEDLIKINPILDSVKIDKPLNKEHVIQFLLEFESKHFEGKLKNDSAIQYIKRSKPNYTIELQDMLNDKRSIQLYKIPSKFAGMNLGSSAVDATGKKISYNVEKYWAYNSYTKEYAIVQHYVFGPILLPYSYFFEEKK